MKKIIVGLVLVLVVISGLFADSASYKVQKDGGVIITAIDEKTDAEFYIIVSSEGDIKFAIHHEYLIFGTGKNTVAKFSFDDGEVVNTHIALSSMYTGFFLWNPGELWKGTSTGKELYIHILSNGEYLDFTFDMDVVQKMYKALGFIK